MQEIEFPQSVTEKVKFILNAEVEEQGVQVLVKKQRKMEISAYNQFFNCTIEHDISFEDIGKSGVAFNKAEIFLLPEEYPAFFFTLSEHDIPFPPQYRQWCQSNPHIISVCLESVEPPEHFAERLADALQIFDI
ncbi:hypothetical protein [Metaplanococcus flavidus]|uniref:Uncharacterized protein n=1 Tax=Metaplanococcus flavidus TaxID=569883 RepID=A0ABW3LD10_9BACL